MEAKLSRIYIICVWTCALASLGVLSHSPGEVVFHFSVIAFVTTECLKYKVRTINRHDALPSPLCPKEPDVQIVGSHYFIFLLFSIFYSHLWQVRSGFYLGG